MSRYLRRVAILALCLAALSGGMVFAEPFFLITNEHDDPRPGVAKYSLTGSWLGRWAPSNPLVTCRGSGVVQMGSYVYVAVRYQHRIDKYGTSGSFIGSFASYDPMGMTTLGGNLWVTSWTGQSVTGYDTDGAPLGVSKGFNGPLADIAAGPDGFLYVTGFVDGTVWKWNPSSPEDAPEVVMSGILRPYGVGVDGTDVYASSWDDAGYIYRNGEIFDLNRTFKQARGMFAYHGKLYFCDYWHKIHKYNLSNGAYEGFFGGSVPELWTPMDITVVVPPAGTLSGTVTLEDYTGDKRLCVVQIELCQAGVVKKTERVRLDSAGMYEIANVDPGTYDVSFKASQWLKNAAPSVNVPEGGSAECNITLVNGDSDGDDEVTTTDLCATLKYVSE